MKIEAGRQKCVLTNFPFGEMLHVCTSSKKEDAEEASFEEKNQNGGFSQGNGGNQNGGPAPSVVEANGNPTLFQLQSTLKTSLGNGGGAGALGNGALVGAGRGEVDPGLLSRSASWSEGDLAGGFSQELDTVCLLGTNEIDRRRSCVSDGGFRVPPMREVGGLASCLATGQPQAIRRELESLCGLRHKNGGRCTGARRKRVSIRVEDEKEVAPIIVIQTPDPLLRLQEKPRKSSMKSSSGRRQGGCLRVEKEMDIIPHVILPEPARINGVKAVARPVGSLDMETISNDSNSYEMVEYGLSPLQQQQRRKSCLCWHPQLHFDAREEPSAESVDSFIPQRDNAFVGGQAVSRLDKVVTAVLILATLTSFCLLFWYQNFTEGLHAVMH